MVLLINYLFSQLPCLPSSPQTLKKGINSYFEVTEKTQKAEINANVAKKMWPVIIEQCLIFFYGNGIPQKPLSKFHNLKIMFIQLL